MNFEGTAVAMVTPFNKDLTIDEEGFRENVNWLIDRGVDGLVGVGTTGESATLNHEEHQKVIDILIDEVDGRVATFAGTGSNATSEALSLTKYAEDAGADFALVITPYYNKPQQHGVIEHFRQLNDNCDIDIVAYNVPSRTGLDMAPETIVELAKMDRISALKEALTDNGFIDQFYDEANKAAVEFPNVKRVLVDERDMFLAHKIKHAKGNNVVEFTVECNPDDISREFAELLVECGVTRVSMGVQSFSDARLRFLHRRHNADTVQFAVRALRNAGIKNISIDLMFGFPGETLEDWEHDISKAIRLDVEHISAYSLQYEKDTPLNDMLEKGLITELDEESCRDMYYHLVDRLEAADYEHYEISNFAKRCYSDDEAKTYRSQHNSSYWQGIPYIGLGAAAHSFDKESRQWNVSDVFGYMDSILNDSKLAIEEREVLDDITKYNDLITTSMRTCEGIDLDAVSHKDYLLKNAKPLIEKGLLSIDNNHIHLTRSGLYVSDYIMTDLILLDK